MSQKEWSAKWYQNNKEVQISRVKAQKDERTRQFRIYKESLKCSHCGESEAVCLEFHHLDPTKKEGTIANNVKSWSLERLQREIEKCIVLCANCHRKEHKRLALLV